MIKHANQEWVFRVVSTDGAWPDPLSRYPRDEPPRLGLFFPDDASCIELNYGQGEGQISIDDREWGVYVSEDRMAMNFVAHDPDITLEAAIAVVESICRKLERISQRRFAYRIAVTDRA